MILDTPLLFSTRAYSYLRDEVAQLTGWNAGQVALSYFPDGERYQRIDSPVNGQNAVLIAGTISDSDTLEFYDQACALSKLGANSLTMVIPYFGYSTMERAIHDGEIVTAKSRARLISAIPQAAKGNRVVFLDLHSEGIPHYLEGGIVAKHLYAKEVIVSICKDLGGDDFVLACTDAGRAKWVESLANDIGVHAAFVFKRRIDGRQTEVSAVSAQVEGARVVIYDDMIRTGGSLINAAKAYKDAGAASVAAVCTHGIFPENSVDRLRNSSLFDKIVTTNSHPRTLTLGNEDFLEVRSVGKVLADHLIRCF